MGEEQAEPVSDKGAEGDSEAEALATLALADVGAEVAGFIAGIDSLLTSVGPVMFGLQATERDAADRFRDYAKKYGAVTEEDDKGTAYRFLPPYDARAGRLSKKVGQADTAVALVPRIFVLALVGQFDAFLGRLLRAMFLMRPEMMANSERTLTLAQLLDVGSVEGAAEYILDKEIETVLRKSRTEQFSWMESKFDVKLRSGLDSWPTLIEVTERRNLFAHTDGVVSEQYLAVCRNNGVSVDGTCTKGTELEVTPEYFRNVHACHFEVGVKLSQVLWRKLCPDQVDGADSNLVDVTFELIVDNRLDLARELLDFALSKPMKHGSAQSRLILTVNRAQAYKWSEDESRCREIIDAEDWSACGPEFRLAVSVLRDDFAGAASLMRSIGASGSPTKTDYQEWPLFKEFRKSSEFLDVYEQVFDEPFVHIEKTVRDDEDQRRKNAFERLREMMEREAAAEEDDPTDGGEAPGRA